MSGSQYLLKPVLFLRAVARQEMILGLLKQSGRWGKWGIIIEKV
jgi:hypothetical protein